MLFTFLFFVFCLPQFSEKVLYFFILFYFIIIFWKSVLFAMSQRALIHQTLIHLPPSSRVGSALIHHRLVGLFLPKHKVYILTGSQKPTFQQLAANRRLNIPLSSPPRSL